MVHRLLEIKYSFRSHLKTARRNQHKLRTLRAVANDRRDDWLYNFGRSNRGLLWLNLLKPRQRERTKSSARIGVQVSLEVRRILAIFDCIPKANLDRIC